MKETLKIAVLMTIVTSVLFGLLYPFAVTGLAQVLFPSKANGSLIYNNGQIVGSRLLGQAFTGAAYFHLRPSAAGDGYDAANSGGSNLGPTNHVLLDRVKGDTDKLRGENPGVSIWSLVRPLVWIPISRRPRRSFRSHAWLKCAGSRLPSCEQSSRGILRLGSLVFWVNRE
jgi:K+-transporting ATPase KdpC subunit